MNIDNFIGIALTIKAYGLNLTFGFGVHYAYILGGVGIYLLLRFWIRLRGKR